MKAALILIAVLAAGCASAPQPLDRVMSVNPRSGKVSYTPPGFMILPDRLYPFRQRIDYGLKMCSVYG